MPPQAVEALDEAVETTKKACPPQAVEAPEEAVEATKVAKRTKITVVARQQATKTLAPPITTVVRQNSARKRGEAYLLNNPSVEGVRFIAGQSSAATDKYLENVETLKYMIEAGDIKTVDAANAWLKAKTEEE